MAKITARGDREAARWRAGEFAEPGAPAELLLTARGRLLQKPLPTDGWKLRAKDVPLPLARVTAQDFGMERVL